MHDPREALAAAIRDYSQWAHGQPGSQQLLEELSALRVQIENEPSPVSQGPGSVPTQKPGGAGQREAPEPSIKERALAMIQIGNNGGQNDG